MELRVLSNGVLEIKKSFHQWEAKDEMFGWSSGSGYLTIDEVERLWVLIPHTLEEMKANKTKHTQKEMKDLEDQLARLKDDGGR